MGTDYMLNRHQFPLTMNIMS